MQLPKEPHLLHQSCSILLCTFNGAKYLAEQLDSLAAQSVDRLHILVSDDGSTDQTLDILQAVKTRWTKGRFEVLSGPNYGFSENFRSLILRAPLDGYVAFCDQDDIWHPNKLQAAISRLNPLENTPALYGGRSILVDSNGEQRGLSPLFSRPPSFGNALVQSIAGGNTMVLNEPAFALLQESARRTSFLMHDWWAYLIVSGAGGQVYYDPEPHIDYRQHSRNALGGAINWAKRPERLRELWNGKYVDWGDANLEALEKCVDLLDPRNAQLMDAFQSVRQQKAFSALGRLFRSGIYRQTPKGDLALAIAAFCGRL
jgi:glycosyltransferase involved in cell wall biosynthesis